LLDFILAGSGPECLDVLNPDFHQAVEIVLTAQPDLVRLSVDDPVLAPRPDTLWLRQLARGERDAQERLQHALRSAFDSLLGDLWPRVSDTLRADLAYRSRLVVTDGIEPAVATVFPDARWEGNVLELTHSRHHAEIQLHGEGITFLPTVFWRDRPVLSSLGLDRPMLVMYPTATPLPLIGDPRQEPAKALAALLGRTRAAVLGAIVTAPSTTGELAHRLGISPGRASEHATVLREAGLITSHRNHNTVVHIATPVSQRLM
jgi:hypothetical protein